MKRHRSCFAQPTPTADVPSTEPEAENSLVTAVTMDQAMPGLRARSDERWQLIHSLLDEGYGLHEIVRRTGLSRGTVRRFARARTAQDLHHGRRASTGRELDAHYPFLRQAWDAGTTNAAVLLGMLRERGYRGSYSSVRDYVHPLRTGHEPVIAAVVPSTRQVTRWICSPPENLTDAERLGLTAVRSACLHVQNLQDRVRTFAKILTTRTGQNLNAWIAQVQNDDQPDLHSFTRGLLADYDAVRAGLTLTHNSGAVEGHVNRIKMIKRKTYGRANLDLLRKLVILGP